MDADGHLWPRNYRFTFIILRHTRNELFGIDPALGIWIGVAAFTFLVILNILGTNAGGAMQTFTTICKLIPVFAIIIFGLLWGKEGVFGHNVTSLIENKGEVNFGRAVLATLFAYDGWILLTNLTGEMKMQSAICHLRCL